MKNAKRVCCKSAARFERTATGRRLSCVINMRYHSSALRARPYGSLRSVARSDWKGIMPPIAHDETAATDSLPYLPCRSAGWIITESLTQMRPGPLTGNRDSIDEAISHLLRTVDDFVAAERLMAQQGSTSQRQLLNPQANENKLLLELLAIWLGHSGSRVETPPNRPLDSATCETGC